MQGMIFMDVSSVLDIFTNPSDRRPIYYNDPRYTDETIPYYSKTLLIAKNNSYFNIINWGDDRWYPGRYMNSRIVKTYVFHFIYDGKGTVNGLPVQKGDCFLIRPNQEHTFLGDETDPMKFYWIVTTGHGIQSLLTETSTFLFPEAEIRPVSFLEKENEIIRLLRQGLYTSGDNQQVSLLLRGLFLQILSLLASHDNRTSLKNYSETIKQALLYIEEKYTTGLTVEEVAAHLNISRNHLFRLFVQAVGISPKEYITRCRVNAAAVLLDTYADLSTQEIASMVGYSSYPPFIQAFRDTFAYTPKEYRKAREDKPAGNFQ
mgnify:CR=1 FL=1